MPRKSKVDGWNLSHLGYECEGDEVTKIWCTVCRDFYSRGEAIEGKAFIRNETQKYVEGTAVVKKCNFLDHLKNSNAHKKAVQRLSEEKNMPSETSQKSIVATVRSMNVIHKDQLYKKFQLAHFLAVKGKSFKFYEDLCNFEKNVHGVDLGTGYLTDTACKEMLVYLTKSIVKTNIVDSLNNGKILYYSIHNDGSSSSKTMDEKELYLIKSAPKGIVHFNVLGLAETEDASAEGLKSELEKSFEKLNITIKRDEREVGMCSDGAAVNVKLHRLIREDLGKHYLLTLCPAHKLELAIHDGFNLSALNKDCEKYYVNVYYLFKKANLRWRLFKRQGISEGKKIIKYKRPSGTRWVEHQLAAIDSDLQNLLVLAGFLDKQILDPYNQQIKQHKSKFQGIKREVCQTKVIIFNAIKHDILTFLCPASKILQDNSLLLPKLITICNSVIKNFNRLKKLVEKDGVEAFYRDDIFLKASEWIDLLTDNESYEDVEPLRRTRLDVDENPTNAMTHYGGYFFRGSVSTALGQCLGEVLIILNAIEHALKTRLESITENPLYLSISVILDSKGYQFIDIDTLYSEIECVIQHFSVLLTANNCIVKRVKNELDIAKDHIIKFLSNHSPEKCWPVIFQLGEELGILNYLQIIELCLVTPLANPESERIYSFLWRIFAKERQSMKNETMEMLLHLRGEEDFSKERYEHAVELFLNEYPDGEMRKNKRHIQGHQYPGKRKSTKKDLGSSHIQALGNLSDDLDENDEVSEISVDEISDDEWTDESDVEDIFG